MATVYFVHMYFFYALPLLLLWILGKKKNPTRQQLNFWLPVNVAVEETGNKIDYFQYLFQY